MNASEEEDTRKKRQDIWSVKLPGNAEDRDNNKNPVALVMPLQQGYS
jgi:hypothetical protein